MDPQQTLAELLTAMKEKRWDDAKELAEALHGWLSRGGFPPTTLGDAALGNEWHRAVATFVCMAAISKVADIQKRRNRQILMFIRIRLTNSFVRLFFLWHFALGVAEDLAALHFP